MTEQTIRFAAIGLNHFHIYGQTEMLLEAGAELVSYYATEPDLIAAYQKEYPQARLARSAQEIYDDESIHLIASASIASERAGVALTAMRHGKDALVDKPGATTLDQLAEIERVQQETGRIWSVYFSEHFSTRCTVKAGELVQAGAIGRVVQTTGFGPHRARVGQRPPWFFERERYGGILTDIASHQIEQFLFFTGSTDASIVTAQIGNFRYPQYPELEDYGDLTLRGDRGVGMIRVDWYTPDGLPTWGDGRLFILGTEGYIELRKYCDIAGRPGGEHLFLADRQGVRYIDCSDTALPFGPQLLDDIRNRTETAIPQVRTYMASRLAIQAQQQAQRVDR
ncbi:MAG: Gfo/Idh/MocA family oxidoreductase [Chloroflexi bacterium]|nr:Gfo/Idh/MocA family oxidoreductase [Chloroflexota bacterium]